MPNTYSQIYIHFVFAVQSRDALIDAQWRESLYQYIGGIVRKRKQHAVAIGGIHDHVHLLVSMNPTISPSDLIADVKRTTSKWINENHLVLGRFAWQEGFGAFSYAKSQDKKKNHCNKHYNSCNENHKLYRKPECQCFFHFLFTII